MLIKANSNGQSLFKFEKMFKLSKAKSGKLPPQWLWIGRGGACFLFKVKCFEIMYSFKYGQNVKAIGVAAFNF